MNRKGFLKKTCTIGAAAALASSAGAVPQTEPAVQKDQKPDPVRAFREGWIRDFLENLDERFDVKTRVAFLETCGRDCARRGALTMAESCKGDLDKFIGLMAGHLGPENAVRDGRTVRFGYAKCYCPMVADIASKIPDTWCNCSRGWIMEMFERVTGKPVHVEMLQSVKRGDPTCEFKITV